MFLLPPLLPLRSLLASFALAPFRAPLSPRAEPYFFVHSLPKMHSWHVRLCIAYRSGRVHIAFVAEARSETPPPFGPRIATPSCGSSPPPWIQGSWQSAYPPPLLSAPLSIWLRPYHQAPTSVGASFFARSPAHIFAEPILSPSCRLAQKMDRMSLCLMHSWHDHSCIADQTVKTYIRPCRRDAAPYPPPSDPRYSTPGFGRILLPRPGPTRSDANPPPLRRATL